MSSNIKIPKICQRCGAEFIARTTTTQYCGDYCSKRAYKARKLEEKKKIIGNVANQRLEFQQEQLKQKEYLSIAEASQLLGASRMTLHRQIKKGTIQIAKLGRRTIIKKSEIEKLFK